MHCSSSLKEHLSYFITMCEMLWRCKSPLLHTFHQQLVTVELFGNLGLHNCTGVYWRWAALISSFQFLPYKFLVPTCCVACLLQTWTCWSLCNLSCFHLRYIWSKNCFSIHKFSNVCIYGLWVTLKKQNNFLYSQALLLRSIYHLDI